MSVYNDEKFVSKSIQSVLNQSYKKFEFIIINDNSSDMSFKIIQKYTSKDKRIKLYNNPKNMGLTKSLNIGLNYCSGLLIARIDSDDMWDKNKLELQLIEFKKNKDLVLCATDYNLINLNDKIIKSRYNSNLKNFPYSNPFVHSSLLIKSSVIKAFGGYNPYFKYAQDFELLRMLSKKGEFKIIDLKLTKMRDLGNSISKKNRKKQIYYVVLTQLKFLIGINRINKLKLMLYIMKNIIAIILPIKIYKIIKNFIK